MTSLFHSKLREMGEVDATITSASPVKSKFAGKPDWIGMKIDGVEYSYNIENDACGEALTGLKGQTVTIVADGSRDEATVEVLGEAAAPAPRNTRAATTPPRTAPARQPAGAPAKRQTPEEREAAQQKALLAAKLYAAKCSVLLQTALLATMNTFKQVPEMHGATTEDIRATANTLFIELKGITDINQLPTSYEAKPPRARQPEPEPEPEPAAEEEGPDEIPW